MTRGERRAAYWVPKASTMLTAELVLLYRETVAASVLLAYLVIFTALVAASATLVMLAKGYARAATLSGLTMQAVLLVVNFAVIYFVFGLCPCAPGKAGTTSFSDAFYFSVVTWTTLGYGDLLPRPELRLMAALEAAVGYMYFGLIVGVAAGLFNRGETEARVSTDQDRYSQHN